MSQLRRFRALPRRRCGPGAAAFGLVLGLVATVGCAGEREEEPDPADRAEPRPDYESMSFPYDLGPAEKRAVGSLLAAREGWRLAETADHTGPGLGRIKRERPEWEPYYGRGDLSADGREDFALALTNPRGTFQLVWFRSAGSEYAPARPVANLDWLDRAGLFVEEGRLVARELDGDREATWAWNPETGRLERR